jgi:hypothetical protein
VAVDASSPEPLASVGAWAAVAVAGAASLYYCVSAFSEAKAAIERREEGERLKQQEEDAKVAKRKQQLRDMFERL